jgi:GntR family transcriptional regulator of arabinose operon
MARKRTMYEQIVEDIKQEICSGEIKKDDRLASELELSAKYAVSRITVRRALEELEEEDLIFRRQGSGSFATGVFPRGMDKFEDGVRLATLIIPFGSNLGKSLDLLRGAGDYLSSQGIYLTVQNTMGDASKERAVLASLSKSQAQGFLFYPCANQANLDILYQVADTSVPLIMLDRYLEASGLPAVVSDNASGARNAIAHLTNLGHRNIGFVSDLALGDASSVRDRYRGYCAGLRDAGIEVDLDNIVLGKAHDFAGTDSKSSYQSLTEKNSLDEFPQSFFLDLVAPLVDRSYPVSAILVLNDYLAINIMRVLTARGIRIPQDLSVVGFDNIELSEHIAPPLTTVEQDFYGMGTAAARALVVRMNGKAQAVSETTFLPTNLIVRASTAYMSEGSKKNRQNKEG